MATTDLEIIVPQKPKGSEDSKEIHRGPLARRRNAEYLPRRKTGDSAMTIWDFGLKWNGSEYVELSFGVLDLSNSGTVITVNRPSLSDWDDLKDEILATDPADWEDTFKKLEYETAEDYCLDFYETGASDYTAVGRTGSRLYDFKTAFDPTAEIDGTKWTDKGLKGVVDPVLWGSPILTGAYNRKVTANPSYSDTEITGFVVSPTAKLFLVPFPAFVLLHSQNVGATIYNWVFSPYTTVRRNTVIGKKATGTGYSALGNTAFSIGGLGDKVWSSGDRSTFNTAVKALTGARGFRVSGGSISEIGVGSWPEEAVESIYINYAPSFVGGYLSAQEAAAPQGAFIGAVKQGGHTYYIWENESDAVTVQKNPVRSRVRQS